MTKCTCNPDTPSQLCQRYLAGKCDPDHDEYLYARVTYTIICAGKYVYAYREPTQTERVRYIRNGYEPPNLIGEYNRPAYQYVRGETKPNYPMPAIRMRTFDSLVKLGYTSAENNFDIDTVFEYYIKD